VVPAAISAAIRVRVAESDPVIGGAPAHPGPPGQPMRTRPDAVADPAAALVELAQQLEESGFGGGDVPGQPEQLGFGFGGGHRLQRSGK
jgi:hypothetical protein